MAYTQLHIDIMLDKYMSTTQKALMCALLSFIKEDGGNTATGVKLKRLAEMGGMSPGTVNKHLKKLRIMGRLNIYGRGRRKEYELKPRPTK